MATIFFFDRFFVILLVGCSFDLFWLLSVFSGDVPVLVGFCSAPLLFNQYVRSITMIGPTMAVIMMPISSIVSDATVNQTVANLFSAVYVFSL